jgi:hypothetical protein
MSIIDYMPNLRYPCRHEILTDIKTRLDLMISWYARVFVVRLDVRFPDQYPHNGKNTDLSELMKRLMEYYKYHGVKCTYAGVREQESSEVPHHHMILFFDGSKLDNGWSVMEHASYLWDRILGVSCRGCIHLCQTAEGASGLTIRRPRSQSEGLQLEQEVASFKAAYNATIEWSSYLAKIRSKGNAPKHVRERHSSQL